MSCFEVTDDGVPPPAMTSTSVSRAVDLAGVNDSLLRDGR